MKKVINLVLLLLLGRISFCQKEIRISFDLDHKKVKIGDRISEANPETIAINQTDSIAFEVVLSGTAPYTFDIRKGSTSLLLLNRNDFSNGSEIKTSSTLALKDISLPDNFSVTVAGADLVLKHSFTVTRTQNKEETPKPVSNSSPDKSAAQPFQPGFIYYDALSLKNYLSLPDSVLYLILQHYNTSPNARDWIKGIENNPFLSTVLNTDSVNKKINAHQEILKLQKKRIGAQAASKGLLTGVFSTVGGLDVTNIADGLAKFLVKRTKQELTIAFFSKLKKTIDSARDLQLLFPQTAHLLGVLGEEIYNYDTYIQNLREAFKKDIRSLPENLPGIVYSHDNFFNRHKPLRASLLGACYITGSLLDHIHPGDILDNFPDEYLDSLGSPEDSINNNYKGALQTLQLLSASLRENTFGNGTQYWVSINKIRELVNDKELFEIYLGLLYQQIIIKHDDIHFTGNHSLKKFLDSVDYDVVYNSYKKYVLGFGEKLDALNKMIKTYDNMDTDSGAFEKYARYFKASVGMLEYCTGIFDLPVTRSSTIGKVIGTPEAIHAELKPYFDISYAVADLAIEIGRKNYAGAINQVVYVYNEIAVRERTRAAQIATASHKKLTRKKADKLTTRYLKKITKRTDKEIPDSVTTFLKNAILDSTTQTIGYELAAEVDSAGKYRTLLHDLIKYGSFMATVVTAQNSDEVEKAIEAAALPVGSSRIKRESSFNVSLNAYPGLYVGHEMIRDVDPFKPFSRFNSYGITAPIGVSISIGSRKFLWPVKAGQGHWSYSLFISLIDVGAVAAFRFKDTTTAQVPSIQLKDIFSPGGFLSIGIPKCPLSVNLGAQMGPNLRKVNTYNNDPTKPSNDYSNKIYWRFSAALCVDIPIFNFYTKSR